MQGASDLELVTALREAVARTPEKKFPLGSRALDALEDSVAEQIRARWPIGALKHACEVPGSGLELVDNELCLRKEGAGGSLAAAIAAPVLPTLESTLEAATTEPTTEPPTLGVSGGESGTQATPAEDKRQQVTALNVAAAVAAVAVALPSNGAFSGSQALSALLEVAGESVSLERGAANAELGGALLSAAPDEGIDTDIIEEEPETTGNDDDSLVTQHTNDDEEEMNVSQQTVSTEQTRDEDEDDEDEVQQQMESLQLAEDEDEGKGEDETAAITAQLPQTAYSDSGLAAKLREAVAQTPEKTIHGPQVLDTLGQVVGKQLKERWPVNMLRSVCAVPGSGLVLVGNNVCLCGQGAELTDSQLATALREAVARAPAKKIHGPKVLAALSYEVGKQIKSRWPTGAVKGVCQVEGSQLEMVDNYVYLRGEVPQLTDRELATALYEAVARTPDQSIHGSRALDALSDRVAQELRKRWPANPLRSVCEVPGSGLALVDNDVCLREKSTQLTDSQLAAALREAVERAPAQKIHGPKVLAALSDEVSKQMKARWPTGAVKGACQVADSQLEMVDNYVYLRQAATKQRPSLTPLVLPPASPKRPTITSTRSCPSLAPQFSSPPARAPAPKAAPTRAASVPANASGCVILVDLPNVTVQGSRASAQRRGLTAPRDFQWQLSLEGLVDEVLRGGASLCIPRECAMWNAFGSEGASNLHHAAQNNSNVVLTKRSTYTGSEKQVDTKIVSMMARDIGAQVERRNWTEERVERTYCLVSGDRDYLDVVETALDDGFRVEMWTFESACAKCYRELARTRRNFAIFFLDSRLHAISDVGSQRGSSTPKPVNAAVAKPELQVPPPAVRIEELEPEQPKHRTRCPFREFCGYGAMCKHEHNALEMELFAANAGRSPLGQIKYEYCRKDDCLAGSAKRERCTFLHEGMPKLCVPCLGTPCLTGVACGVRSTARSIVTRARLTELRDAGYFITPPDDIM